MAGSVRLTATSSQSLTRATPFDYNADYTVCGWFTPSTLPGWQGVVTLDANGQNLDWLAVQGAGENRLFVGRATANVFIDNIGSGTALVATTHYFGAMVASGTTLKAYLGTTAANVAQDGTTVTQDPTGRTTATTLRLGVSPFGDYSDGEFGGWRAYTRALTLAELKVEAAVPTAVVSTNLWGDWTLPDASTLTDSSGNGRTLTATNGPLTTGSVPPYIFSGDGTLAVGGAATVGSAGLNIHRRRGKLLGRGRR